MNFFPHRNSCNFRLVQLVKLIYVYCMCLYYNIYMHIFSKLQKLNKSMKRETGLYTFFSVSKSINIFNITKLVYITFEIFQLDKCREPSSLPWLEVLNTKQKWIKCKRRVLYILQWEYETRMKPKKSRTFVFFIKSIFL